MGLIGEPKLAEGGTQILKREIIKTLRAIRFGRFSYKNILVFTLVSQCNAVSANLPQFTFASGTSVDGNIL